VQVFLRISSSSWRASCAQQQRWPPLNIWSSVESAVEDGPAWLKACPEVETFIDAD
jgi:hypothetical protein